MPDRLTPRPLGVMLDPEAVFRALEARHPEVFWLDAGAAATDGWSFLGTGEPAASPTETRLDTDRPDPSLPPFTGGWVGWRDYETGASEAGAPVAEHPRREGERWLRVTHAVAVDHARRRAWALADAAEVDAWAEEVAGLANGQPPSGGGAEDVAPARETLARHTPSEYAALIEECRALIRAGIAYQLCLTTRFRVPGTHDAVAVYGRLRAATPAHHGGFLRIGGLVLLSASPEQFLHASGGVVRTRPIKGTRPRATDAQADAALAADLAADPKERAENVMIVDLMRNDLSRVCVPGSIRVDALWAVESYPAVHQLVSTVSGTVAAGTTVGSLFRAAFPAGSMTGAPKLSAMTRLAALEGAPRGIYAGCFGYVGADGNLDLAMVIRSIVIDASGASVGAGGGITWGSAPAAEVAEVATKARAPLAALGAGLPGPWGSDILN